MKKLIAALCSFVIVLALLVACGQNSETTIPEVFPEETAAVTETTVGATEEATDGTTEQTQHTLPAAPTESTETVVTTEPFKPQQTEPTKATEATEPTEQETNPAGRPTFPRPTVPEETVPETTRDEDYVPPLNPNETPKA